MDLFVNLADLQRSMDYHLQRHTLLSSNIANVETPGYRSVDLSFDNFMTKAQELQITNSQHMSAPGSTLSGTVVYDDIGATPGNDNNTVSMEREMGKLSANNIRYRAVVEMLSRRLSILKYAVNDGTRR